MYVLPFKVRELLIFVLCVMMFRDLIIDWGNPSNNLNDCIIKRAQKYEKDLKHEREMRALELNASRIAHEESIATKFDLRKNVRLVPPFSESEVDKYFQHFERVPQCLKWPTDQFTAKCFEGESPRGMYSCKLS